MVSFHTVGAHISPFYDRTDFTEADLQITKDNILVLSHDPTLESITNINEFPEFKDRMKSISFEADGIMYSY